MDSDKRKHIASDPQAEREAQNYAQPIPSREYILEMLGEEKHLFTLEDLAYRLGLGGEEEVEALRRRVGAMVRDGQLHKNRKQQYGTINKMDLVRGHVDSHQDGFGFLHPDDGSPKLFIPFRQMQTLFHGDRIVARITGNDTRGRREAALVQVVERGFTQVVGRFFLDNDIAYVEADNKHIHQDILIPTQGRANAQHGQFVMARIVEYPSFRSRAVGEIIEVLGDHMAPGMEIDVAIRAHDLPAVWPQDVLAQVAPMKPEVEACDFIGRKDLRELAFVTIDGEDARDFDDAVYGEPSKKGWRLWVAIADVAHYVQPGTPLDQEAYNRGNSVYFPQRVIPMLPEILSNELCSLKPKVNRLALVCEIDLDKNGAVTKYKFYDALIYSHARLTYNQVSGMLYENHKVLKSKHTQLIPHLENLDQIYQALRTARTKRGAIDFESSETQFIFADDKKIERIVPSVRNDAHRLIEECMITANVCAAQFLDKNRIPALYRVHEDPEADRIKDLREFLKPFGLQLKGGAEPQALHYARLLQEVRQRPDVHLLQTVLLRSMQQAVYACENAGHFGLALDAYAHFTSPIRRYPDLVVHRAIKHIVHHRPVESFIHPAAQCAQIGEQCSMTERRADDATREAVAWLKCEFMLDKIGERFNGVISGVTSFGFFVELQNIYIEGLVHVSSLGKDYFHYDATGHRLVGERTHSQFRLGDPVQVTLVQVNLDDRKMDFELIETQK